MHDRKGWRPPPRGGLVQCAAITGACIVIDRALVRDLGGFDEDFVIGDFEDADLCLKLHERGLARAIDLDVHLYHLERQSQAGSDLRWRMNLTLHNAWVHERRWGETLRSFIVSTDRERNVAPEAGTGVGPPVLRGKSRPRQLRNADCVTHTASRRNS
jgi:GT2 family glycosyltransferase